MILADWAAVAINNARLYETSERRRQEAEKAFRGLEATRDVAVAIGGEIALEHVLELIVKRGRALVGARSLVIMLRDGHELVVQASAGHVESDARRAAADRRVHLRAGARTRRVPSGSPTSPHACGSRRRSSVSPTPRPRCWCRCSTAATAVGVLAAFDRGAEGNVFSEDDEQMLRTFAASAATAVALAQSVQSDRLRSSLAAADAERRRWARELHDETLQGLGGLRLLLSSARRGDDLDRAQAAMGEAVEHIEREIANLRSIITELRPAALDELGLRTAIEALLDRHREQHALEVDSELQLPGPAKEETRFSDELETTVYRLVQEALTNVAKHARARHVSVVVTESDDELPIEVKDDGAGFDPPASSDGFGLAGMHERVSSRRRDAERRLRRAAARSSRRACRRCPAPTRSQLSRRAGRVVARSAPVRSASRGPACGARSHGGSRPCGARGAASGRSRRSCARERSAAALRPRVPRARPRSARGAGRRAARRSAG